jgi:hypothetical protein
MVTAGAKDAEAPAGVNKRGSRDQGVTSPLARIASNSELRTQNYELQFYLLAISSINANRITGTSTMAA